MMSELEKDRLKAFVNNMNNEEAHYLVSLLSTELMINEVKRREILHAEQLSAIKLIMSGK